MYRNRPWAAPRRLAKEASPAHWATCRLRCRRRPMDNRRGRPRCHSCSVRQSCRNRRAGSCPAPCCKSRTIGRIDPAATRQRIRCPNRSRSSCCPKPAPSRSSRYSRRAKRADCCPTLPLRRALQRPRVRSVWRTACVEPRPTSPTPRSRSPAVPEANGRRWLGRRRKLANARGRRSDAAEARARPAWCWGAAVLLFSPPRPQTIRSTEQLRIVRDDLSAQSTANERNGRTVVRCPLVTNCCPRWGTMEHCRPKLGSNGILARQRRCQGQNGGIAPIRLLASRRNHSPATIRRFH